MRFLANSVLIFFSLHILRLDKIVRPSIHSDDGFLILSCLAISVSAILLFHGHNCYADFIIRIFSLPLFAFLK